jgi:serine/threonine protein kinase
MSPEQALGLSTTIDGQSDIYSLGATLYELLTLQPVFATQDRQRLINQIASEEPIHLRQLDERIPRELETVILKALAKDPRDRYATARELAADLSCFLECKPIKAKLPNPLPNG